MKLFRSIAVSTLLLVALTGCSQSIWVADAAPVGEAPATAALVNDLAAGSVARTIVAGDAALAVTYWSTLTMDQWTPGAEKPLSLALSATLGTDAGQQVYLAKLSVAYIVNGPGGPIAAGPAPFIDAAAVVPGYLVKAPYSYNQSIVIPAIDAAATSVDVTLTYEVLVQASPGSSDYAKQTGTDTLSIVLQR